MIDIVTIVNILLVLMVMLGIVALVILWREMSSGSYKRYVEKRKLHLEQLGRVQKELNQGDKRGR